MIRTKKQFITCVDGNLDEEIAITIVKALYFAYGVDESYEFEIKPAITNIIFFPLRND
jgi:hypothetical protein